VGSQISWLYTPLKKVSVNLTIYIKACLNYNALNGSHVKNATTIKCFKKRSI